MVRDFPILGCGKLKVSLVIYAGSVFSWQVSGVFGNNELQFPLAEGMVIYKLQMSACMHTRTNSCTCQMWQNPSNARNAWAFDGWTWWS